MSDSLLKQWGNALADHLGDGPEETNISSQRRAFLTAISNDRPRRRIWIAAIAVVAVLTGMSLIGTRFFAEQMMPFQVIPGNITGTEGHWVKSPNDHDALIRFASGSLFSLAPGASARVASANHRHVILDLGEGKMHCRVQHNGKTTWGVRAGTYHVQVTGTVFVIAWEPTLDQLKIRVDEGSVLVSGAELNSHGIALTSGEHLLVSREQVTISHREGAQSNSDITTDRGFDAPGTETTPAATEPPPVADETSTQSGRAVSSRQTVPLNKEMPLWKERFLEKDYPGTIDAARREGLSKLVDTLGADDLWKLAQASRYARNGPATTRLLMGIKARFPDDSRAHHATFLLGRVAVELERDTDRACRWFDQYLNTTPNGPLAEEALGRLIDLSAKNGNETEAKRYANRYLNRYPQGAFAKLARSVLH